MTDTLPADMFPVGSSVTIDQLTEDPHPVLARLRAEEPVSWLPALGGWLVTRRGLVEQVLRDPDGFTVDDPRFTTARVVGPSMLSLDGPEHRRHRDPFARCCGAATSARAWPRSRRVRLTGWWRPFPALARGRLSCGEGWPGRWRWRS